MNYLITMRGAPGSGKSTLIDKLGLRPYTICPDDLRLLVQSPQLKVDGSFGISQKNEREVWDLLFKLTERRMDQGEVVVIDATFSKSADFTRFKKLTDKYRYRVICLDMSKVPLEHCIYRNAQRPEFKRVPEDRLKVIYERFAGQEIQTWVQTIDCSDTLMLPVAHDSNELYAYGKGIDKFKEVFAWRIHDYSNYRMIHHIGDVHSCLDPLLKYFEKYGDPRKIPNELFIFVGDLLDRGPQSAEVMKLALELYELPNVIFLHGNHEKWIWLHANEEVIASKEYLFNTKPAIDAAGIDLKDLRRFYRKLCVAQYYKFHDKEVLVTHGGLSTVPKNLVEISSEQIIKGVGAYKDMPEVSESFTRTTKPNQYQVFGHRNIQEIDIQVAERNFCLEGQVEFGKNLRCVVLDDKGFIPLYIKNDNFIQKTPAKDINWATDHVSDMGKIIQDLRKSKYVNEKQFPNNISSFNFTRDAFYDKKWNEQTLRARGLFIDTAAEQIVARSYPKFFNIGEFEDISIGKLTNKFKFPLNIYKKENGFLGMLGYQPATDELIVATKSSLNGPMNELFMKNLTEKYTSDELLGTKHYLKVKNATLVIEVVDPIRDPHIIDYDNARMYLLDIVYNEMTFSKKSYDKMVDDSAKFDMKYKKLVTTISSWPEFMEWYNKVTSETYHMDLPIEGYVIEDANGFMVKIKTYYYSFWKRMRGVVAQLHGGRKVNTSALYNVTANRFYNWLVKNPAKYEKDINMLTLRKDFLASANLEDILKTNEKHLLK